MPVTGSPPEKFSSKTMKCKNLRGSPHDININVISNELSFNVLRELVFTCGKVR